MPHKRHWSPVLKSPVVEVVATKRTLSGEGNRVSVIQVCRRERRRHLESAGGTRRLVR